MRVLFLQRQPCMRALKYAVGLRRRDPEVRLAFAYQGLSLSGLYGAGDELFEGWMRLDGDLDGGVRRAIDGYRPDLVHSHNLPDLLTVAAVEQAGGRVPVLHDVHDLQSLRATPYEDGFPEPERPLELERRAIEESDALLTVSDELLEEIAGRHAAPERRRAFPNYALERDLPRELPPPERPLGPRPRIVYQGSLSTNGGHYDLREIFARIVAGGASLDIHPARPAPAYRELAAAHPHMRCHEPMAPGALLAALAGYDFGWAGFNDGLNAPHLHTVLPNKAYDYVGCGLPILTLRHRALERMVRDEGLGVVLESPDDLGAALREVDLPALRRRAAASRERLTVEANIGRVSELYRVVAAG
jgi:hypothetical protein